MKCLVFTVLLLMGLSAGQARAADPAAPSPAGAPEDAVTPAVPKPAIRGGTLSLGVQIGSLTGVDLKFWMDRHNALDVGLGNVAGSTLALQATYLWHRYNVFHSERDDLESNLPLYFGAGGLFAGSTAGPLGAGVPLAAARGVMGIDYLFNPEPFDVYLEIEPTLYLNPDTFFAFHAAMGGRYRF